jgi:hypothetical protein
MDTRQSKRVLPKFIITAILAVMVPWTGAAPATTADVGLITALTNNITYWNKAESGQPAPAQTFMKVRLGDNFKLPDHATLKVLYFNTGRQETWTGPCLVTAGDGASKAEGCSQPEVYMVSAKLANQIKTAPLPLPRSNLQFSGAIRTMGEGQVPEAKAVPQPTSGRKAEQEITQARKVYRQWRQKTSPEDFTPELYLLGVLAEHGRYQEMDRMITEMRGQNPRDPALLRLQTWVRAQMAQAKPFRKTRQD